jgi:hypothetical protein
MKAARLVIAVAAFAEAATGVVLLVSPSVVTNLLFAADATGVASVLGRITGIALIALGTACWPYPDATSVRAQYSGLLTYNALTALLLSATGFAGQATGTLLWAAVVLHAALAILLLVAWLGARGS